MPYYLNRTVDGIILAAAKNDGYTISLKFARAFPSNVVNRIGYNIYMAAGEAPEFTELFFRQQPAFIYTGGLMTVDIVDLTPGQLYQFGVRAFEYDPSGFDYQTLPQSAGPNLYSLPQSLLSVDVLASDTILPLLDASEFPNQSGMVVRLGYELISYQSVDLVDNLLLGCQRGLRETFAGSHTTDGYYQDAYGSGFIDPYVVLWPTFEEEQNIKVAESWCRFDIDHYAYTTADGYHQITKDILTTDLTYSDAVNTGFPAYDFAGWHRTDPVQLLNGTCVGSYIGGYQGCADSNGSVGGQLRGFNIQDANLQRQEVLLSVDGEPVCLLKRTWTGITCKCYLPSNENPSARCKKCFGGGIVLSYSQFFDPRRSDGRIMVKVDPSVDDLLATDAGLESDFKPNCWTLAVPTVKDRDFIVRFDEDNNEEFRYEILNVTRNKMFLNQTGAQKFAVQRVRKTDIIYQVPVFRDTSIYPQTYQTGITASTGLGAHQHSFVISNTPVSGARQLTGISQGHNHIIEISPETGTLVVREVLGHTHSLF